ncbi:hypothetical protein GCM10020254_76090 [Streptomyces goshikiensis]
MTGDHVGLPLFLASRQVGEGVDGEQGGLGVPGQPEPVAAVQAQLPDGEAEDVVGQGTVLGEGVEDLGAHALALAALPGEEQRAHGVRAGAGRGGCR